MGKQSKQLVLSALAATVFVSASPASAVTTFFNNWDSTDFGSGAGFSVVPSYEGWTAVVGSGIEVQYNNVAGLPLSGENLVELDSFNNTTMERLIDAGDYVLSFYYSPRPGVAPGSNGIAVLVNGQPVFSITGQGGNGTVWTPYVVGFSLAAPGSLGFAAIGTADGVGGYLEDVGLAAAAVPEPASWAMMIGGFALLGGALRRRRTGALRFA